MNETNDCPWEVAATASGMTEAKIIAGRLESEDIPVKLRYEAVGAIYALTVDGLGEVRILVPVSEGERARRILARSYEEGDLLWEPPSG